MDVQKYARLLAIQEDIRAMFPRVVEGDPLLEEGSGRRELPEEKQG